MPGSLVPQLCLTGCIALRLSLSAICQSLPLKKWHASAWWQKNETRFKTLARSSKEFLCPPPSTVLVKGCSVKWACFMKPGGATGHHAHHSAFAIIIWGFLTLNIKIELELEMAMLHLNLLQYFKRTSYVSLVHKLKYVLFAVPFFHFGCYFLFQFKCMSLIYLNIS